MRHIGAIEIVQGVIFIIAAIIALWRTQIGFFVVIHGARLKITRTTLKLLMFGVALLLALFCGLMLLMYVSAFRNEPLRRLHGMYILGYAAMLFEWLEILVRMRWYKRHAKRPSLHNRNNAITLGDQTQQLKQEQVYQENAKVTGIFWEWRHKIMTHFFGAIGAVVAISGWLYVQHQNHITIWHCFPLLIGGIYSYVSYLIDSRHTKILRRCYDIGAEIERSWPNGQAVFTFIQNLHYTSGSLTQILQSIYRTATFLLLGLSVLVLVYSNQVN